MKGVKNLKPRENISLRFWINMIFSTSKELSFYVWCYLFWNILIFRCKSFIKYSSPLNNFSLEIKSINTFMHNVEKWPHITLRKTCPYLELFWSVFPLLELIKERSWVSLRIQYKRGKIWTRKTPNTDTFQAV